MNVTFKGNPLALAGKPLVAGIRAPAFVVQDNTMAAVSLASFKDKVLVLVAVPSLDTPVCDMETRKFNEAATKLGDDVAIAVISMDLPFAQARWCGAAGIQRVKTYSDHLAASFGLNYGVLIKEWRLLARAVFVVDKSGTMRYVEVVSEITSEPDYKAALDAIAATR